MCGCGFFLRVFSDVAVSAAAVLYAKLRRDEQRLVLRYALHAFHLSHQPLQSRDTSRCARVAEGSLQAHTPLINTRDRTALRNDIVIADVNLCTNAGEVASVRDFGQVLRRRPARRKAA